VRDGGALHAPRHAGTYVACACADVNRTRLTRHEGVHHVSQATIGEKAGQSQTARRLKAQERLERDCRQAQHAAKVLEQALHIYGGLWQAHAVGVVCHRCRPVGEDAEDADLLGQHVKRDHEVAVVVEGLQR
jgi:hypothetical protein